MSERLSTVLQCLINGTVLEKMPMHMIHMLIPPRAVGTF